MDQRRSGLSIDVYSDVVCPWCYIGKRRLERALEAVPEGNSAEVLWRPFQLNPTMPRAGLDRRIYLEAKFGGPVGMKAVQDRVAAVGTTEGIDFAFDRIERTPNTFDAHRLIWLAQQAGRQDEVVEVLFCGYFTDGLDIGSIETLVCLAIEAGLGGDQTSRFLQSDEGRDAVRREESQGHQFGIRGVPYFILNERYTISGAQPLETFVSEIGRATH